MRVIILLTLFIFFAFPIHTFSLAADLDQGEYTVILEKDKLSVNAEKVALQSILFELVAQGVTIKIDPAINPRISVNFINRPLEQALETLLKPASYSLVWETKSRPANKSSLQLIEIQVFQTGQKENMRTLQPQRTEIITKNKEGVFYVKDEILLYLPPGSDLNKLRELVKSYKAILVANTGLAGLVKILLPENSDVFAIAREIKNELNLEISQPNYAYPLQVPVSYPTDSTSTGIDPKYYAPADNSFPIAILDSGLDDNTALQKFVLASLDVINPNEPIVDTLGHGTQMALIASGVVKPYGATKENESYIPIIPIRAFDDNGYTTDFKIMDAINFALKNNARVMSLSWGSETKSDFMERAFATASAKGLIIVASAGNEPTGKPVYPAAYSSVIGVGALDPHGKPWENSNYGNFVALYAPGFANLPVGHKGDPGLYAGTSISAAFIANSIAGYLSENPDATIQEIGEYLHKKP